MCRTIQINGKRYYLWRAVDQEIRTTKCFGFAEVVDLYLQASRDGAAGKRFFKRILRSHGGEPGTIAIDELRSYGVAHRELIRETIHRTRRYEKNRAQQSHEATMVRERGMRKFEAAYVLSNPGFAAILATLRIFNLQLYECQSSESNALAVGGQE